MKENIEITNISFDSLFKLFFFGIFPVMLGFSMLVVIVVLFKGTPETPEPNQLYGWQAVMVALFMSALWPLGAGLLFAAFGKLGLFATFKFNC